MESHIDTIRLDADTKTRLSTLKRRTGIENWNILCRWAFCISVADKTPVRGIRERGVGAVEMTWKTFAGEEEDVYLALLVQRAMSDVGKLDRDVLGRTIRQHIARGAARLVSNRGLKSAKDLIDGALGAAGPLPSTD